MNIINLENFQQELEQAREVFSSLHGNIASLQFDPKDMASVSLAIARMETAIDQKVSPYRQNLLVCGMADELKKQYRAEINRLAEVERVKLS
jgi:hypothetical protein